MSMTQTRPGAPAPAGVTTEPDPGTEPSGLAGWLTTSDHKRVGRLYLATALTFLVVGGVLGGAVGVERIGAGYILLGDSTFGQVYTLHGEVAVLLFLVPFFLGLATYLVPLQVGAPAIAFPRGSATAYWTYVVAGGLLLAAYAANGGPGGGSAVGVDLYLLSLIALNLATVLALVSILTTIITLRAPGLTLDRAPLFTWSLLVGGGLTLLTAPVLVARLIELYIRHHFGGDAVAWPDIAWFWSVPQVYLLAVPAAGVALEVVPVVAARRLRDHRAGIGVLAGAGVLGFGAYAQAEDALDDLLYVGLGLAAAVPAVALLGLLAGTARRGRRTRDPALLLGLGAAVHLLLGALAGALAVLPFLGLGGTVWGAAQVHLTLGGGALLAALAALWYWAPKIWGVQLAEPAGTAAFALVFPGAALLAAPDLVNGLFEGLPLGSADAGGGLAATASALGALGGLLVGVGLVVAVGALGSAVARHRGAPVTDDPWGGHALEWSTSSPPPVRNFAALPVVRPGPAPGAGGEPVDEAPAEGGR